jgi:dolichol-phosphate mannosyltransferase
MKYQIIIPSKDEFENLKIVINSIKKKYNYNILVIDKSKNINIVKNFCSTFEKVDFYTQLSKGKGNALKEAALLSKAEILIFFDADCSHHPDDIKKIVDVFESDPNIRHVGGSRMRGGSDELFEDSQHILRLFGSLLINLVINKKFNTKITDSQNGLRAINKNLFLKCSLKSSHTSIETELVAKTLSQGIPYKEIPTHEWKRNYGKSKINLMFHSWEYIFVLIKIFFMKKQNKGAYISYDKPWYKDD